MKIVYVGAGAAGMYCGSCLHDNTLAAALLAANQQVLLVPAYTPLRTDEENVSQQRIFFGAINVYLQNRVALFRHTPEFLDSLLDSPRLISWLTQRSSTVDAAQLGDLTVSVLRGPDGYQRKELDKLVRWLDRERPDLVHLSNSMLVGMVGEIRRRVGVPVVCSLSGEDLFLERLVAPHYAEARQLLREKAADVDAFVALNRYYAEFMTDYLSVDPSKVHVIPHGLKLEGHSARKKRADGSTFTIGYLARIAPEKGLHLLVEAFINICARQGLPPLKFKAAGYLSTADKPYLEVIKQRLKAAGVRDRFEYVGELNRSEKIEFLCSLDVMSVPTVYRESKGLPALEAMANAVPVVLPAHGTFPELIEDTGGGLLHQPGDPAALADQIAELIANPKLGESLGRQGQSAVHSRYHAEVMARRTLELYQELLGAGTDRASKGPAVSARRLGQ